MGFADATAMEGIALKAMVVFHVVCLQKPSVTSTSKQHLATWESRLAKWSAGNVDALLRESRAIQQQLPKKYKQAGEAEQAEHDARVFARLVIQGKIKAAIRYICEQASNTGVMSISQVVSTSTNKSRRDQNCGRHSARETSCRLPSAALSCSARPCS